MKCRSSWVVLACLALVSLPSHSQTAAARMVTESIDETRLVTLHGNVHPLAQAPYDRGKVDDSLAVKRVLLLLNRPAEREAALQKFLADVHRRGSGSYHRWLTPSQFGERFGPADSDIQAASNWLRSHGFTVAGVTKSRRLIEFSGTAGQVREAFHTEIHQYQVSGETHFANSSEISFPAAFARLVGGVSPLHNFHAKPYLRVAGPALYSPATKKAIPQWTITNPFGTSNPYAYPVAPADFATQYDLGPLYQAGINGSGQTIAIINESNIDLALVAAFQQLFGLSQNPTQVVIDGDDPGLVNQVDIEAYLDVEVSGAVAPSATVNLYISNGSDFQDPIALASLRAIEDNQASVLSVSFGQCEQFLGNSGNQFWSALWEQAAAQGQTVLVATGDTGPECSFGLGLSVSGIASTPWNVAVGGTDFYYSDYGTGGASATTLWNPTNHSNLGSLEGPLPEQVWNDPFGLDIIADGLARGEIFSGGGGASSCVTQLNNSGCTGGNPKPIWQVASGVPSDNVRDLPDVSLFASNGANLSAYPICAYPGECVSNSVSDVGILLVGGTSASSPAMAGILALVNQKYGRQGQANFTLYPLSQKVPTAFHDITLGSNDSVCLTGVPDCSTNANGANYTTVYPATSGYDLATGLGSVDANVLVNNWNAITFLPTSTTLSLSAAKITHGTPITVTASVAGSSSGTPTGGVAILTASTQPASTSQTVLTLSGGTASGSVAYFPGGYYNVTAAYQGDAIFAGSTSDPVALWVTPENSNLNFSVLNEQSETAIASNGSIAYNVPLFLTIQPAGVSAPAGKTNGNATGTATFSVDSFRTTVPLNGMGVASWAPPALAIGSHTASASYSGDGSFNPSTATPVSFSVTKGSPWIRDFLQGAFAQSGAPQVNVPIGGSITVTAEVGPFYGPLIGQTAALGTAAPTGTVTFCLGLSEVVCGNPVYSQTIPLASPGGTYSEYATATATFTNLAPGQYGQYFPTFVYNGDATWQNQGWLDLTIINVGPLASLPASTTNLTVTPASISGSEVASFTTTVTGKGSIAPTGWVDYYNNGIFLTYAPVFPASSGATSSVEFILNSSWFWQNGANQISAIYQGDPNYLPSFSNSVTLGVTQFPADFSLSPQAAQILVPSGNSATLGLNLASAGNFSGAVTLTCTPSSSNISCSVNPSSPTVSGTATATLTVSAAKKAALAAFDPAAWEAMLVGFAFVFLWQGAFLKRSPRPAVSVTALFAMLLLVASCGGGRGGGIAPPPPSRSTYSVVVSGTANGIIHNAKVIVVVE